MAEIAEITANGPTADEMQKLQNQLINDGVRMRQSSMNRAQQIAEFALYDGDATLINTELDALLGVTADQIRDAVATFLNTENRSLLDVRPAGKG
jgi:predicted Zn-dependent peptidase